MHYLWWAIDQEGEVPVLSATKRRDRRAALKFLKRAMERYGRPGVVVTGRLRSYGAAMDVTGNSGNQSCARWLNRRDIFNQNRSVALAEWRQLAA